MSRASWALMTVAIAAMIAGLTVALRVSPPVAPTAPSATQSPPSGVLTTQWKDLEGQPQALGQYKGRLLILNFWATWCAPCVEEMPDLQRVQDEYAARGVSVVGMGIDAVPAMRRFRDEHKLSLTLLAAATGGTELARELGNSSGALPFTVLIDVDGQVAQRRLGRISAAELRLWLDAKLGPRPG